MDSLKVNRASVQPLPFLKPYCNVSPGVPCRLVGRWIWREAEDELPAGKRDAPIPKIGCSDSPVTLLSTLLFTVQPSKRFHVNQTACADLHTGVEDRAPEDQLLKKMPHKDRTSEDDSESVSDWRCFGGCAISSSLGAQF